MSEVMAMLPRYRCHKEVWALKINFIRPSGDGEHTHLVPENTEYAPIAVSTQWMAKHGPVEGGYWVQYEDGYTSYSPAAAFEEGYTLL